MTEDIEGAIIRDGQQFVPWLFGDGRWELVESGPIEAVLVAGISHIIELLAEKQGKPPEAMDTRRGEAFSNDTFDMRPYTMEQHDCMCAEAADGRFVNTTHDADCPDKPNFKCGDIEVRWYKRIGRGLTVNRVVTLEEVWEMFRRCKASLQ